MLYSGTTASKTTFMFYYTVIDLNHIMLKPYKSLSHLHHLFSPVPSTAYVLSKNFRICSGYKTFIYNTIFKVKDLFV